MTVSVVRSNIMASPEEGDLPKTEDSKMGDEETEEEPKLGLLQQDPVQTGKRARKSTVRLAAEEPKKEKPPLEIKEGSGIELGTLDNVCYNLEKILATDQNLKMVHNFLFGSQGKKTVIKKNIRKFSGFTDMSDAFLKKKQDWLGQKTVFQLKTIAEVLDVDIRGTKEDKIEQILDFAKKPTDPGHSSIRERVKKKTAKRKRAASKKKKATTKVSKAGAPSAKTPRQYFALEIKNKVKAENPDSSKEELMRIIKDQYEALSPEEMKKYEDMAAEAAKEEEDEDEDESEEDEPEDDDDDSDYEEKKRTAKKKAPKKSAAKVESDEDEDEDEDSDEEDMCGFEKSEFEEFKAGILDILGKESDVDSLTPKMILAGLGDKFPDKDIQAIKVPLKKLIKEQFTKFINART
eukprot:m.56029 g.56029  ORF g.56029 m.56029 type:complete len:406 (-) comp11015_c1_seq3:193-1410(-)